MMASGQRAIVTEPPAVSLSQDKKIGICRPFGPGKSFFGAT